MVTTTIGGLYLTLFRHRARGFYILYFVEFSQSTLKVGPITRDPTGEPEIQGSDVCIAVRAESGA